MKILEEDRYDLSDKWLISTYFIDDYGRAKVTWRLEDRLEKSK